jgi:hypothetical protein
VSTISAFGVPPEKHEELRQGIIAAYGEKLELIAPDKSQSQSKKRNKKRRKRKRIK